MNRPASPPTDDELHAWIDGQLPADRHGAVEDAIARDPEVAAKIAAWHTQRDALRRLHGELLDEPVPAPLMSALERDLPRQAQRVSWLRWGGMAAGLLVAFAAGWLGRMQWAGEPAAARAGAQLARGVPAVREFVHDASVAHAVYAPEKRHPVEVAAAEQQHLVQWLSKRLDRPLKVPDLSSQGYVLVGGRLLPGESGARAQFMFEDPAGERVTLYIGTLDANAAGATAARETAFRFASEGPVPSFYWVDQGFGYALAGKLPREVLLKLATLAYRDLS